MPKSTVKSTTATIQSGVARADGNFWATESEVIFEPFNKSSGLGPHKIERDSISKVDKCMGKGAGIIPLTSDAIEILLRDGTVYQFIVANPNEWVALLNQ